MGFSKEMDFFRGVFYELCVLLKKDEGRCKYRNDTNESGITANRSTIEGQS